MIEIVAGVLIAIAGLATSVAAVLGLLEGAFPIPVGPAPAAMLAAFGLCMVAHGAYRMRVKRNGDDRHWLRTAGTASVMLLLLADLALALPLAAPFLNAFKIAGFPFGYYMAAQGSLVLIVLLLFVFASRADAVDVQEESAET
ncbi:MAG: sodium/substrate symporter small subunit [Hyphomicrobium sp.]